LPRFHAVFSFVKLLRGDESTTLSNWRSKAMVTETTNSLRFYALRSTEWATIVQDLQSRSGWALLPSSRFRRCDAISSRAVSTTWSKPGARAYLLKNL